MQIENEYGNVQLKYGSPGHQYILWAADLANSLDTGVPWFMCQNDDIQTLLTACNGFYCDNWIQHHWRQHYQTPPMFTELWTGWFQHWRTAKPVRPTEDLAFSATRWIARGGSFVGYYMWHGGTNFGRSSGDFKTTSYDYDAPLNEYGFPNEPKYSHLGKLHRIVSSFADLILASEPREVKIGDSQVFFSSLLYFFDNTIF
jgi:beta-galactosidase